MSARAFVVALDGPAGAGKSTVARAVAARLGVEYLDTGAMYRAVTFAVLRRGVSVTDTVEVARLATVIDLEMSATSVVVDGVDATAAIRGRIRRWISLRSQDRLSHREGLLACCHLQTG